MSIRKHVVVLAAAASALAFMPAAMAADYDPPLAVDTPVEQVEEYVPAELGSGWYLRGDIGYNFNTDYKDSAIFADEYVLDGFNLGQYGPIMLGSISESTTPISASIGMGYHLTDYLRADITGGLLSTEEYSGSAALASGRLDGTMTNWWDPNAAADYGCLGERETTTIETATGDIVSQSTDPWARRDCSVSGSAENKMYDGMASLYLDLGTYSGFTPYIGAGLGVVYSHTKANLTATCDDGGYNEASGGYETSSTFTCAGDVRQSGASRVVHDFFDYDEKTYNLMYGFHGGVAYKMTENASLDFGYTYKMVPDMKYYAVSEAGVEERNGLDVHQVRVGLRYDIW